MKKTIKQMLTGLSAFFIATAVNAALPTSKDYGGNEKGDLIAQFKGLFADAYEFIVTSFGAIAALIIGVIILVGVYEWRKGQKELSEVATIAATSGIVLSVIYYLLNLGSGILA